MFFLKPKKTSKKKPFFFFKKTSFVFFIYNTTPKSFAYHCSMTLLPELFSTSIPLSPGVKSLFFSSV